MRDGARVGQDPGHRRRARLQLSVATGKSVPFVSPLSAWGVEDQILCVQRANEFAQRSECLRREDGPPRLSVLGRFDPALAVERAADWRPPVRNFEIAPAERRELARTHTGVRGEQDERRRLIAVVAVLLARDPSQPSDLRFGAPLQGSAWVTVPMIT